jgi:hypothetical protein
MLGCLALDAKGQAVERDGVLIPCATGSAARIAPFVTLIAHLVRAGWPRALLRRRGQLLRSVHERETGANHVTCPAFCRSYTGAAPYKTIQD